MIQDLPAEILEVIFSYLSEKDVAKNIRYVCRKWSKLAHIKSVTVHPSINYMYKSLIDDFAKNSTFARNIQQLVLIDDSYEDDDIKEKNISFYYDCGDDKLASVCKNCFNLSQVTVKTTCANKLLKYLESEVLPNILKLERLVFNLPTQTMDDHDELDIDLSNMISKQRGLKLLRHFTITVDTSHDDKQEDCWFRFDCKNIDEEPVMLSSIKIECEESYISRACLLYFISGNFKCLKTLKLSLIMIDSVNGTRDEIWDKFRNYCKNSLDDYDIFIRDSGDVDLFSFDNCIRYERSYSYIYYSRYEHSYYGYSEGDDGTDYW